MRSVVGSEFRRRRSPEVWHRLNGFVTLLICLGVAALVTIPFLAEFKRTQTMTEQRDRLEQELKAEQLKKLQKEREVTLLETDPEYIETIARDKLDLMKDGETIYRLDTARKQIEQK